ncbi:hypothetical protein BVX94_01805 [bacterium B17]|nr:hypothetical protein BVX94_01805 [bacterium B17]
MNEIDIKKMTIDAVDLWLNRWMILTAGTQDDYNMMTVAWGSIGCMWFKPFAQVVVRPQRYTREFMEKYDTFTLCAFPDKHTKDLQTMGSVSGRNTDKLTQTSLTIKSSSKVDAPSYNEANFILECRKMYFQDMDPENFVDEEINDYYPEKDYHRIYFGEILAAYQS